MNPKYTNILLICAAIVAAVFLWDYILEVILALFGAKLLQVNAEKKAIEAKIESEFSQEMADIHLVEVVNELAKAKESHQAAKEIAEKPAEKIAEKSGFKRKSIRSR